MTDEQYKELMKELDKIYLMASGIYANILYRNLENDHSDLNQSTIDETMAGLLDFMNATTNKMKEINEQ